MIDPPAQPCVVGIGEALFDLFDAGPRLGGAPLNVAVHSHRLLQAAGGSGAIVSKIADDELGQELIRQVASHGLPTQTIQAQAQASTGQVTVEQYPDGGHSFHIAAKSAWDELELTPEAVTLAKSCHAVAFGTLAQRSPTSRQTIHRFLAKATNALKLFDVNFRSSNGRDYFDASIMTASCEAADLVKVNDEELDQACALAGVDDPQTLLERFELQALILTRGPKGTAALTPDGWIEGEPARYERQAGADTVGAGDACSAGLLSALVLGRPLSEALNLANHMGAFVANQSSATPELPEALTKWLAQA